MRHGIMHSKFGIRCNHRKALFLNLTKALITHGRIETTITKAKALRPIVEQLVTKAKKCDTISKRRFILSSLHQDEQVTTQLIEHVAKHYGNRPGGYTRLIRTRIKDDKTQMVFIEFTDFKQ